MWRMPPADMPTDYSANYNYKSATMEITRNYLTNGNETMQARLQNGYYTSEEQKEEDWGWHRAEDFAINIDSLNKKYEEITPFYGNIYNENGQKTKVYEDYKKNNVPALWFVNDLEFRPSADDYKYWDGHILLDLDKLKNKQPTSIFNILKKEHPEWMVLVKYSGSGSIHILCHTEVKQEYKTERHFKAAFDTFSILLNELLAENGLQEVKTDTKCRRISQCMCLWKTEDFVNANQTYNIFETDTFKSEFATIPQKDARDTIVESLGNNNKAIRGRTLGDFEFVYDTNSAKNELWIPKDEQNRNPTNDYEEPTHAGYNGRIAVVLALVALGVSKDDTKAICSYGFESKGLSEVDGYWTSSQGDFHNEYLSYNLSVLKEYLDFCGIRYSLQAKISVDENVRPLHDIEYDHTIRLGKDEYLCSRYVEKNEILDLLETTDKKVVYLKSAPATGKTEMAKHLMDIGKKVLFVCGRNTVLEGKLGRMDIDKRYGGNTDEGSNDNAAYSVNQFIKQYKELKKDCHYDYIIIDEIHLVGESFRKDVMTKLLQIIHSYSLSAKLVLMTGTPSIETYYLPKDDTLRVAVEKEQTFEKNITPIVSSDYNAALNQMLIDVAESVQQRKKVFIVENDTKRNAVLTDYFNDNNIKIVDFNRQKKNDDNVGYVLKNAKLPNNYDGIIITSYLGVGNEIKDDNQWDVFFMPTQLNYFTANDIEQFANRIRNKNINAKIYYFGYCLSRLTDSRVVKQYGGESYKNFLEYKKLDEEGKLAVSDFVKLDKASVRYDVLTYQHLLYESSANTVLSLLHNLYNWNIQESVRVSNTETIDLSDNRARMNQEEKERFNKAYEYMNEQYANAVPGDESIGRIAKGIEEYYTIVGGTDFLHMETLHIFYDNYHRMIAQAIYDFGGEILFAYGKVVEGKELTMLDLNRILNRHRLADNLKGDSQDLLCKCAEFINEAKMPFDRNSLSEQSKRKLQNFISGLCSKPSPTLAKTLLQHVLQLCQRDSNGHLALDISDLMDSEKDIKTEIENFIATKIERRRKQKRESKKKKRAANKDK